MQKVPVGGQKFNSWTDDFFSNFVGGKNLTPFSAENGTFPNWPSPRAKIPQLPEHRAGSYIK